MRVRVVHSCSSCGEQNNFIIDVPDSELKSRFGRKTYDVTCLKCGHKWAYKGFLKHRIQCPECRSTRNEVNRNFFGEWIPSMINR